MPKMSLTSLAAIVSTKASEGVILWGPLLKFGVFLDMGSISYSIKWNNLFYNFDNNQGF